MCGITGFIDFNSKSSKETLTDMTSCLAHRGPDGQGIYYTRTASASIGLGHRRLSILDLSDVANQPMYSASGRYIIVYNGELYNFSDLKSKDPGFQWKTEGDTEVILELFAKFGTSSFSWLNGMFAIAIYDTTEEKIYLARDQAGIKPFFYFKDEGKLIFASELKSIWACQQAEKQSLEINKKAIPSFLHLGFIPEPDTIYKNVYKFPAAHFAVISCSKPTFELTRYWDADKHFLTNPITSETVALATYKELLFKSVGDQMVSDVPLGTFLSGGIDSSLVTAIASQISSKKINTFSIGFEETKYDESAYAEAVATKLGTNHHEFKVSVNDVLDLVPLLLDVYDEPFADSSAFPTMLVSKLARQHVTVALSGDGGDELFQGYGMYTWANRLNNPFLKAIRKPLYYSSKLMNDRYERAGKLFNYPDANRLNSHIFSQEQYFFSEQELSDLLVQPNLDFNNVNSTQYHANANPAEKQAFWDFEHYLKDDLLVKVDRAGMFYSLETRVPLLDKRLVEFALNLDYSLKVRKGYGRKYLMKKVLYELVPRELFERPKRGFAIPLKQWLKGPLSWMIQEYLNEDVISRHGFVHCKKVNDLLQRFRTGHDHLYNRIWTLIVLHWWLEKNLSAA